MTSQSISARFGGSFYAYKNQEKKKMFNGYTGYKWIGDYLKSKKELTVYLFPIGEKKKKGLSKEKKVKRKIFAEAIEAELVFKIRCETKKWTKYQHEIHFHNIQGAKEEAGKIYEKIKN